MIKKSFLENINDFYIKHRVIYNCVILSVLFFFNCFLPNLTWLIMPLLLILVIIDNFNNAFTYLIFCLPFCCIDMPSGCFGMVICFAVFLVKLYIIKYFKEKNVIRPTTIVLVAAFLFVIIFPAKEIGAVTFLSLVLMFCLIIILNAWLTFPEIFNLQKNVRVLTIALAISTIFSINYYFSDYLLTSREIGWISENLIRFQALLSNPNMLAMFCEFCMAILLYYVFTKKAKIIDYIFFGGLGVLGVTTFSKTFLIVLCFMVCSLVVFSFMQNWKKALIFIGAMVLICGIVMFVAWDFVSIYLSRFIDLDVILHGDREVILDYVTTGRSELWSEYLEYMADNPFSFLWGMGAVKPRITILSTHNFYLSMFYQFGIIGTGLFISVIVKLIYDYARRHQVKISKAIIVPLIVIGLICMVEDIILYIY